MARLGARSVKSKQKATLRYIASTDIERTARDYGVSTRTLRNFVSADPKTLNQTRYSRILSADAKSVAQENDVRLVPRLTGERYKSVRQLAKPSERQVRSLRYTAATRERIRHVDPEGKVTYRPAKASRVKTERDQILNQMSGMNTKTIMNGYHDGLYTKSEAKKMLRKLYANSGVSAARANAAFDKASEE